MDMMEDEKASEPTKQQTQTKSKKNQVLVLDTFHVLCVKAYVDRTGKQKIKAKPQIDADGERR